MKLDGYNTGIYYILSEYYTGIYYNTGIQE